MWKDLLGNLTLKMLGSYRNIIGMLNLTWSALTFLPH